MKRFYILFSLLFAVQALPLAMRPAAAQSSESITIDMSDAIQAIFKERNDFVSLRAHYSMARSQIRQLGDRHPSYTYDEIDVQTKTLADGNQIKTERKKSYARDPEGRTRITYSIAGGVERVAILDPVAQEAYLVRPEHKDVLRLTGAALAPPPPAAPPKPLPDYVKSALRTQLGAKDFDGVTAAGLKSEFTIPAGTQNNERDMVQTSETWHSSELGLTLYSRSFSPLIGENVRYIENLKQVAVPSSLFALPEGYPVRDAVLEKAGI